MLDSEDLTCLDALELVKTLSSLCKYIGIPRYNSHYEWFIREIDPYKPLGL